MERKFRALRTLATLYKILGWIVLIGGILLAAFVVILGAVQTSLGPSPILRTIPGINAATDLITALVLAAAILVYVLLQFLVLYAISEAIHLALAIEQNTRETAYYLRGEVLATSTSPAGTWQGPTESSSLDN